MKHLRLYEEFNPQDIKDVKAKVITDIVSKKHKIESSDLTYETIGKTSMPELTLNLTEPCKDTEALSLEIRDALKLKDSPRVQQYPKEKNVHPLVIDLF